jgi:hypothetical protein
VSDKVVLPLASYQAWNIGPLPKDGETPPAPPPEVRAEACRAGDMTLRYHTGKLDKPGLLIFRGNELVAVLWPEQLGLVMSYWMPERCAIAMRHADWLEREAGEPTPESSAIRALVGMAER